MSIDLDHLIARMEWACARNLSELAYTDGGVRVTLRRDAPRSGPPDAAAPPAHTNGETGPGAESSAERDTLDAPLAGICHLVSEDGGAPYVAQGDTVTAGETVCVIEAMKVMTSITAPRDGTIAEILVGNGAEVGIGVPLMRIS